MEQLTASVDHFESSMNVAYPTLRSSLMKLVQQLDFASPARQPFNAIVIAITQQMLLSFLNLPPEIRNVIYDLVFQPTTRTIFISKPSTPGDTRRLEQSVISNYTALLMTCSTIKKEATPFLYQANFKFHNPFDACIFALTIGPCAVKWLTHINIDFIMDTDGSLRALKALLHVLGKSPVLKTVRCDTLLVTDLETHPRRLFYDGVRPFLLAARSDSKPLAGFEVLKFDNASTFKEVTGGSGSERRKLQPDETKLRLLRICLRRKLLDNIASIDAMNKKRTGRSGVDAAAA